MIHSGPEQIYEYMPNVFILISVILDNIVKNKTKLCNMITIFNPSKETNYYA